MKDLTQLSKLLSYILRHNPGEFGVTLDKEGWTCLSDLIDTINQQPSYKGTSLLDIVMITQAPGKKRFDLDEKGDRIRAFYGHSVKNVIELESATPPDVLYHGTAQHNLKSIEKDGLKPMKRQHVHHSTKIKTARVTALRHSDKTVVLVVDAKGAHANGVKFYPSNDDVWQSDPVPPEYLKVHAY